AKVNTIGAVVCLATYACLIPVFKVPGAVAATLLSFLVVLICSFREAQRLRRFQFEYSRMLRIAALAAVNVCGVPLVPAAGFVLQSCLASLLASSYGFALLFGCFNRAERRAAMETLGDFRRRLVPRAVKQTVPA